MKYSNLKWYSCRCCMRRYLNHINIMSVLALTSMFFLSFFLADFVCSRSFLLFQVVAITYAYKPYAAKCDSSFYKIYIYVGRSLISLYDCILRATVKQLHQISFGFFFSFFLCVRSKYYKKKTRTNDS
jgi:hypothetical protein